MRKLIFDEVISPGGFLAFELLQGDILRVIDLEGKQVGDMVCFNLHDVQEYLSCVYSNIIQNKWLLSKGDVLYSNYAKKMLTIIEDLVGIHFSGGGFCSENFFAKMYGIKNKNNCQKNLINAFAPYNIKKEQIHFDSCFNIFMNIIYEKNGKLKLEEPISKAGDYVDFYAEVDCLIGISNCPSDKSPANAYKPTSLEVKVLRDNINK